MRLVAQLLTGVVLLFAGAARGAYDEDDSLRTEFLTLTR